MLNIKGKFLNWLAKKTICILEKEQMEKRSGKSFSFKELHKYVKENKNDMKLIRKISEFKNFYILNFDIFMKDFIINNITEESFYKYRFENEEDEISLIVKDIIIEYPINVKFLDKVQIIFLENYIQSAINIDTLYDSIDTITKEYLSAIILSYDFLYYEDENDRFVIKIKLIKESDFQKIFELSNKINLIMNDSVLFNIISK